MVSPACLRLSSSRFDMGLGSEKSSRFVPPRNRIASPSRLKDSPVRLDSYLCENTTTHMGE